MKKLVRSEKLKLVEGAKTIAIVLLFSLCLFLGYRILNLYKAQTNVEGAIWGSPVGNAEILESGSNAELKMVQNYPKPYVIMTNTYTTRQMLDTDSQMFDELSKLANQLLTEAYAVKNEDIEIVEKAEWQNALMTNSFYIKYPAQRFLDFESEMYDVKQGGISGKIKSFDEIILTRGETRTNEATLFVAEYDGERILKIKISGDSARDFAEKTKKLDMGDEKNYAFAWELNLDEKNEESKTVLQSMLIIPVGEEKTQEISISVPKLYKTELSYAKGTDLTLSFINAFNYNPNTIRRYVDRDDSIKFVGETGSLSLHPDGLVEYKALDWEDGVPLSTEKKAGGVVRGICVLLEKVMRISGINTSGADFDVLLTDMPQNFRFAEKTKFGFEYFVNGSKVEFPDTQGITAVVQGGNLVELKMNLKDIEVQGKQSDMPSLFDVIDEFCVQNPRVNEISNARMVYNYKEDTEGMTAEWMIEGVR